MNKIAANPFMITTGKYWLIGVQHRRRLLGQDRGEETEVPGHCNQICAGESRQKAHQSEPSHPAALSRVESGKAEQDQQPAQRVHDVRSDQPDLARNDRGGRLMARVQQRRHDQQHTCGDQGQPACSQQTYPWSSRFSHHASPGPADPGSTLVPQPQDCNHAFATTSRQRLGVAYPSTYADSSHPTQPDPNECDQRRTSNRLRRKVRRPDRTSGVRSRKGRRS